MKLKYYLRGLGIGIILTVIIMTVSFSGRKETRTNEEIMEEARKLGMIMPNEEDAEQEEEPDPKEESTEEEQKGEEEQNEKPDVPVDNVKTPEPADADNQPADATASNEDGDAGEEDFLLEIKQGDVSADVCRKLFQAKRIADVDAFNKELAKFDLDKELRVGTYHIPADATELDIIAILGTKP